MKFCERYFEVFHNFTEMKFWRINYKKCPQQGPGSLNCFLFMKKYVECLMMGLDFDFSEADMATLRAETVVGILRR